MICVVARKRLVGSRGAFQLNVDFNVNRGEFLSIFGKSGSGKTTILRIIAGLEVPDEGYVEFDGKVYFDSKRKINLPPQRRNVGFVFQNYTLFPNMTVYENLIYASGDRSSIERILQVVELSDLRDRYPSQLSGGQQQRVALARALVKNPDILLLDEPLSALDQYIRLKLQEEIKSIQRKLAITTILVSHDKSEVFRLADRVILLEEGVIKKVGSPKDVLIEKGLSGKFTFFGEVIDVRDDGVVKVITVDINGDLVQVVSSEDVEVGEKVLIGVKAFNPIIKRV
ncbi:MAG: ABC transporter ATP-binding protein [Hydrogenothermaceae bacterium]|nr:ABC transporter ATP-binding protein [Hydrogenothermaceae bacterium]